MPQTEQQQLIHDTLHYRPSGATGCFVVNDPGLRLISSDASALPSIKAALLAASRETNWDRLYGLDYVIGAFLVLATKHAPETIVPFIQSLPQAFATRVIATVPAFFRKKESTDEYNFATAPSPELIEYIDKLSSSDEGPIRKTAERVRRMV